MKRLGAYVINLCCLLFLACAFNAHTEHVPKPIAAITLEQIKQSAEAEKDEMVEFVSQTVKYESVEAFGYKLNPETEKLISFVLGKAKKMGFSTRTAANGLVGIIEYGQGKESVGVLIHLDVVPASKEDIASWTYPPFEGKVADGYVWGRGSQDDKGALASTLWAAKILIDHKVSFNRRLRIILGTKEEKSFESMIEYFKEEAQPDFGFIPDGIFITQAEKGIADLDYTFAGLSATGSSAKRDEIVYWTGGTVINSVPDFSFFVVKSNDIEATRSELLNLIDQVTKELKSGKSTHFFGVQQPYVADLKLKDYQSFIDEYAYKDIPKGDLVLFSKGLAVHASSPWSGKNAIVEVALVGSLMRNLSENAYQRAFRFVAKKIGLSFDGSGLTNEKGEGIPFINPVELPTAPPCISTPFTYYGTSANLGLVTVKPEADHLVLSIDFRTGLRNNNAQILHHSRYSAKQFQGKVDYQPGLGSHYEAFYCPNDHPLLGLVVDCYQTLNPQRPEYHECPPHLDCYKVWNPQTPEHIKFINCLPLKITSAATTYLKLVKNFVNFGPVDIYPDVGVNYFHQKNERVSIESLQDNLILYAYTLQKMLQMETAPIPKSK